MNNSVKYCLKPSRIRVLYFAGFVIFVLAVFLSFFVGSTNVNVFDIVHSFSYDVSSTGTRVFLYVRFPRTVATLLCGAAFAVSGAVIQSVLANNLASPGIIGVNSGAGLAVTISTAIGIYGGWMFSLISFLGAFLSVMIVSIVAKKWNVSRGTVVLIGVALNSLLGAFSDMIITFAPEVGVMSNDFKIGEFTTVTYSKLIPSFVITILVISVLMFMKNQLSVLTIGDDNAKALGMNTGFMRMIFLLFAALLAGCAVSISGLLSFVGLIVPNVVRRLIKGKTNNIIGLCALYGSTFVCICDTIARTAFSPFEIPVGMIMAFVGAPFFLYILMVKKGGDRID